MWSDVYELISIKLDEMIAITDLQYTNVKDVHWGINKMPD